MNKILKIIVIALAVVIVGAGVSIPLIASASEGQQEAAAEMPAASAAEAVIEGDAVLTSAAESQVKSSKAMWAAIVVGISAAAGAIGMAFAISKSTEGVARQPEAGGRIQTMLMLGLVFIETAIIYALIVAILIIFVL